MILQHLELGKSWEKKPPETGVATFLGKDGTITIHINKRLLKNILAACADEIVNAANEVSASLKAETISEVSLIENKSEAT